MKRLNPETGKPFKVGYIKEDGLIFHGYVLSRMVDGMYAEHWLTPEARQRSVESKMRATVMRNRLNHKENKKFLNEYKVKMGCIDCGYKDNAVALDFDHVRGVKSFDISRRVNGSQHILVAEMSKCDIRCANCHRVITEQRRLHAKKTSTEATL